MTIAGVEAMTGQVQPTPPSAYARRQRNTRSFWEGCRILLRHIDRQAFLPFGETVVHFLGHLRPSEVPVSRSLKLWKSQ